MSHDLVGRTLGKKYRLERLIGHGGMGAVYEARHIELNRRFAIKVLASTFREHPEVHARFRREARAASAVESEHIVQVVDTSSEPGVGLYMVMEYLCGEDLESRLGRERYLPLDTVLPIARQILRGLEKAHAAGVVHRDLKPANIFLVAKDDGSTQVKIVDFGISKLSESSAAVTHKATAITRAGNVVGTAQYMSPEQAKGLASLDHRTDIWSLGALLYECMAGALPFPGAETYEQAIVRIVTSRPAPLRTIAPWVPAEIASAIDKALSYDAVDRHQTCGAFLRALGGEGLPGEVTVPFPGSCERPLWVNEAAFEATVSVESRGRTELVSVSPIDHVQTRPAPTRQAGTHRTRLVTATVAGLFACIGSVAWCAGRGSARDLAHAAPTGSPVSGQLATAENVSNISHETREPAEPTLPPPHLQDAAPSDATVPESVVASRTKPVSSTRSTASHSSVPREPPTQAPNQAPRPFGGAGVTNAY